MTEMKVDHSLIKFAANGVFWSVVQSWVNKLSVLVLSIVLARLISPADFGVASAGLLILQLVPIVAELGFSSAIIQRPNLKPADINLPFYFAIAVCCAVTAGVALNAEWVSAQLEAANAATYISFVVATLILNVPTMFQLAMFKRNMKFKTLAFRDFVANLAGGILAVVVAALGFGFWSFLAQAYAVCIVNAVWLWRKPLWTPSLTFDPPAFGEMAKFGLPVAAQNLNNFLGMRLIDFLIIGKFGVAAYGIYAVGSRLYQSCLQIFQGAFNDVSLSSLSKISDDRERLGRVYGKTMMMASSVVLPLFVMLAVLSPEICLVLFGEKWVGLDRIATPLMLLGALGCVQFLNGPFLAARGKTRYILLTGAFKTACTVAGLIFVPAGDIYQMTVVFVVAQLPATPLSFYMVSRELGLSLGRVALNLLPPLIPAAAAFAAVRLIRPELGGFHMPMLIQGIVLGACFGCVYIALLVIIDRKRAVEGFRLLLSAARSI